MRHAQVRRGGTAGRAQSIFENMKCYNFTQPEKCSGNFRFPEHFSAPAVPGADTVAHPPLRATNARQFAVSQTREGAALAFASFAPPSMFDAGHRLFTAT